MRRLAIIPARGGSKRIPGKNIRDFCGKPMIGHILQTVSDCGLFDTIHISTDSEKITKVVTDLGFAPDFSRPAELADDHTPIMTVLKYVAEQYGERGQQFDQVWLLMACAPLIDAEDLLSAAWLADEHDNEKAVISIAPYPVPVEWAFELNKSGTLTPVQPGAFAVRSQDISEKYFDTGSYVVFPTKQVLNSAGAGSDTGYVGQVISKDKVVDIDSEQDWILAETLFRGKHT